MPPDGVVVIATPMAGLEPLLRRLPARLDAAVLWLCKGFQDETGLLGHEIARQASPTARVGVLSGPSFAIEVARGQPTALVAASSDESVRAAALAAFHGASLRIYTSADPVGVEVGGAVKNVLAIATGIADGMALGLNARAALVTRGLAEMTRLGVALGADAATFMGLSGLGDLVLTTTGDLSRNRTVGVELAAGKPLATILAELGHVAEGVRSAPMVLRRAAAGRSRDADRRRRGRGARRPPRPRAGARAADAARGAAGVVRRRSSDRPGVAVLAPGLEHRHRDGVAEVEAALAGAHRQAQRAAPHRKQARSAGGRPVLSAPKTSQSPGSKRASASGRRASVANANERSGAAPVAATSAAHDACRRTSTYSW